MNPTNPSSTLCAGGLLFICFSSFTAHLFADQKQVFDQSILPLLKESCLNCHSTKKQKGDLDLERFASLTDIKKEPMIWQEVLEQIKNGEMPPKKEPPLSVENKTALLAWTQATLDDIALASAGDPGPVVLRRLSNMEYSAPIIVNDGSTARRRFEAAFDEFRTLFPIALCYERIVPVDEVVTLTLFYREDGPLKRLMLDEAESSELDRLWDELRFVSEWPLKQVDVFEQLFQFATQDAKPSAFESMRQPILRDEQLFKTQLVEAEPRQLQAVLDFAMQAWRRPLREAEQVGLRALYQRLRKQELPHATAVRMLLARVLVAPEFLYRGEKPAPGQKASPVNDWEFATRLSYFLWSSAPDEEISQLAASGRLQDQIAPEARRMMKSDKIRRLATEFGCQWLHVRDVATLDEKSERHFPTFASVREDMQEEVTRFFIDLFQNDRSVLTLLDADHSFINANLAKHYGIEVKGDDWRRIDALREKGRGGILGFAATLAKQSGASRNSAILRGTWLSEVILGDKLPIPPKGVPVLPEEPPTGLSERQLIERHSRDANCMGCHKRIDPFGFALEGFDAIGRARQADTKTVLPDGTAVDGLADLRDYLLTKRCDDFLRQFCRKLVGYALGRGTQLSDKPLIDSMMKVEGQKIGGMIDLIIRSPQFREVRGRHFSASH
jgi:hypothetical protein